MPPDAELRPKRMDTVLRATLDTTLDFFWGLILSEEAFPVLQEFHDSVGDRGLAIGKGLPARPRARP